jgi:DNA-binding NarL/FixJ family response regulator
MRLRLVIAEDSYLIREGLRLLLARADDVELVGAASSLPELLATVELEQPDVVLTDIRMPPTGTDEGVRAAELFAEQRPEMGVVVLSQYVEPSYARRLLEGGASGRAYLLKERLGDLRQLRHAIAEVARGGSVLDPAAVDALVETRHGDRPGVLDRLSPRELEVLGLVARGLSNGAIAEELVLSERAVEKHISAVLAKLDLPADDGDVHRRVRAVLLYLAERSA